MNIFLGGADFSDIKIKLPQMPWVETKYELIVDELGNEISQPIYNYLTVGNFVSAVINFLILAFVVFWIVKIVNKLADMGKKPEEPAPEVVAEPEPPAPSAEEVLLTEIRDLLKNK